MRGWATAVLVPPVLTASLLQARDGLNLVSDVLIFLMTVVAVALIGGMWPALLAAVWCSLLLNWFFTPPFSTLTISDPNNALALAVFIAVAMAVSTVVDLAARRTRQAGRAAAEAQVLANLAGSVVGGDQAVAAMLDRVRETFGLRSVRLVRGPEEEVLAISSPVEGAPPEGGGPPMSVRAGPDLELVLEGPRLGAADQRVVAAFAVQTGLAWERSRLTEAAAAAVPLAEADRFRTALLAAVGHDLRTPLAAAKAAVTGVLSTDVRLTPEDQRELLTAADESLDRLAALVDNLLDLSRLQAGVMPVRVQPVFLDEVVALAVDHADPGHRVVIDLADDVPLVEADPGLLERVLANLVENAVRHSPAGPGAAGPDVLIGASRLAQRVEVRVVDRGPGIPSEALDRVFQPFQRLGDTDNTSGVGLGLALARGLTEAMGGRLTLEETPGGGLTMVVSLQVHDAGGVEPGRRERGEVSA